MVNYGDFFFSPILQYHMEAAQGQEKIWKFCPAILFRIFIVLSVLSLSRSCFLTFFAMYFEEISPERKINYKHSLKILHKMHL